MTNSVEHPLAYYRDIDGVLQRIEARLLRQPEVLETAQLNFLTDAYEQFRLHPRVPRENQPHFYSRDQYGQRVVIGERDPTHDKRVADLASKLSKLSGQWSLCCRVKDDEHQELEKHTQYSWGAEVTRHLNKEIAVRHDLFGASASLSNSHLHPSFAIEVVHTHYPEEQAFEAMLRFSEDFPCVVFFEHTRRYNKFIKVDSSKFQLIFDKFTYFIRNGRVWQGLGEQPTGIQTSAALKIALEGLIDGWDAYHAEKANSQQT